MQIQFGWFNFIPWGNIGFAVSLSQFFFVAAAAVTLVIRVPSSSSVLCFFLLLSRDDDVPFGTAVSDGGDSEKFHEKALDYIRDSSQHHRQSDCTLQSKGLFIEGYVKLEAARRGKHATF